MVLKEGKCLNTYNCALVNLYALFHRKTTIWWRGTFSFQTILTITQMIVIVHTLSLKIYSICKGVNIS